MKNMDMDYFFKINDTNEVYRVMATDQVAALNKLMQAKQLPVNSVIQIDVKTIY